GFFNNARPHIQGNPDLRNPQVVGWFRTRQHFRNSNEHANLEGALESETIIPAADGIIGRRVNARLWRATEPEAAFEDAGWCRKPSLIHDGK
ncbi:MAG: hypothetical protein KBH99_08370, partial [Syntrophobacteraceae bacterium]|nr:hypothetical protein [Syntrophobacteraceae bacterium]